WTAGGSAVDDRQRSLERLEPAGQIGRGESGAAEAEPGRLAVVRAVADQNEPQRFGRGGRNFGELLLKQIAIGFVARLGEADRGEFGARRSRGFFPAAGPLAELLAVFLRAFGPHDDEDERVVGGRYGKTDQQ